jgi:type III pantothenate kinase
MNLVIDIGNSHTKLAVFEGPVLRDFVRFSGVDSGRIMQFVQPQSGIRQCIVSSVRDYPGELDAYLSAHFKLIRYNHETPVPVAVKYGSRETLGLDRLAGMVAAANLYPGNDVLVLDAGTAITFDLLLSGEGYMGGAIAPGVSMRYQALHTFTGRLPLLERADDPPLVGNDTAGSIHSGVINGVIAEAEGIIARYLELYPALKIILTGGDYLLFDKRLKIKTFAAPNFILEGLNIILSHNDRK